MKSILNIILGILLSAAIGFLFMMIISALDIISNYLYTVSKNKGKPKAEWDFCVVYSFGKRKVKPKFFSDAKGMIKGVFANDRVALPIIALFAAMFVIPVFAMDPPI